MANLKSSKKDIRRTAKRTLSNKPYRDNMRAAVKGLRLQIVGKNPTKEAIVAAQKSIDKAAKKGLVKKQAAARLKSRLMKQAGKVK